MVKMSWDTIVGVIGDDLKKHIKKCPKCGGAIIEPFYWSNGTKFNGTTYCLYCGWNKQSEG